MIKYADDPLPWLVNTYLNDETHYQMEVDKFVSLVLSKLFNSHCGNKNYVIFNFLREKQTNNEPIIKQCTQVDLVTKNSVLFRIIDGNLFG